MCFASALWSSAYDELTFRHTPEKDTTMVKEKQTKKEGKKAPLLSPKEKKAAKAAKKASK